MLLRYYHTLKHLRLTQFTGRIRHRLHRPKLDLRDPAPLRHVLGPWHVHDWREPAMLGPTQFRFLNHKRQLAFPEAWNTPEIEKLWLYNLHYFDDLNAKGAKSRLEWHQGLMQRWTTDNSPATGNGWEPYPLSLRIVNWIKWALAGNDLSPQSVHSLAVQVRFLRRRLEFHLLGNHLFENTKALIFAGLFFTGKEAEDWLRTGTSVLAKQLEEQILADGGHFELSPMYHSLILEGMLDLLNLFRAYHIDPPGSWPTLIASMVEWLRCMCHPDGGISFFNDAAFGVAPSLAELEHYAASLGITRKAAPAGSRLLEASCYARLEQDGAVLLADVAAIGPDYLPGHAHADSLSFELSLHGQRILVNSGTSVYGTGEERLRQRSTAAHNTLQLDGANSSEVWSGFRVARRALVRIEQFDVNSGTLAASHDGYKRLAGRPVHRRLWTLNAGELVVSDTVEGGSTHSACVSFHFYPDCRVTPGGPDTFVVTGPDGSDVLHVYTDPKMRWGVENASWHPGFGLSEPSQCLSGSCEGSLPLHILTKFVWRD
jgi:uncharacterized heparinase superfamily protein